MTSYDISSFMAWWVTQVVTIIGYCWNTLDSIQFGGTSILRVMLMIIIFGALFKVTLTIPQNIGKGSSERIKKQKQYIVTEKNN